MDKGFLAVILSACATSGAFVGGFSEALHNKVYAEALSNPNFYYLVDEDGNPVRQSFD